MTDGYPYQLSQRSVVGQWIVRSEVKGAEDQYAWSTVNIVGNGPVAMVLTDHGRSAGASPAD